MAQFISLFLAVLSVFLTILCITIITTANKASDYNVLLLIKWGFLWVETLEWLRLSGLSLFGLASSFLFVGIYL
jgi:hypothetical protein